TFVPNANPLSDAVNSSANVGKLTHNGGYTNGNSTAVDIDSKVYSSYEVSVYSPNTTKGKVQIQLKDASGNQLDWYEQAVTDSTKWIKYTRNLVCTSKITAVTVFFNNGTNSTGTAKDTVYLDNIVFKKSTFNTLYGESFAASWSPWGSWSGAPSTKAGSWFGKVNLQTTGDANINLDQWWGDHGHVLKITPTDAVVIIPDINVAGFDSLKLSADMSWPWSLTEQNAGYYSASDADKSPLIDVRIGAGDWVPAPTSAIGQNWATPVILLKDVSGNPISNVNTISIRLSQTPLFTAVYDNVKILGKVHNGVPTSIEAGKPNVLSIYPNPATTYIVIPASAKASIFNLSGEMVKSAENCEKVDVSSLPKGVYLVKMTVGNSTTQSKFVKK
ncbi:MAG: T9SS type A sorting domain-containing protein, partial [Bacteroidota bacterium]|nr:T9SS type A sorting domain-containing protein [Bacteroidota bacterium]